MNILPNEILDIILNNYWMYKFKSVTYEINHWLRLDYDICLFFKRFCFKEKYISDEYLEKYLYYNEEIIKITKKKINKIICKNNKLCLYYCFDLDKKKNLSNVNQKLILINIFIICISGDMRYHTYDRFQKLSLLIK